MGITLSMGEQSRETFERWKEAGAERYLLRIEASNRELYHKLHPHDDNHSYEKRLNALKLLQDCDYQVGTGVMVGLPFQTTSNLADDLLFFKDFDIDMIGLGPYIEHEDTPLYQYSDQLKPQAERFELSMRMVALLRILMKDVNIAATTAMQSIDELGREKVIKVGANVLMPNITPVRYREGYLLYENKPCLDEDKMPKIAKAAWKHVFIWPVAKFPMGRKVIPCTITIEPENRPRKRIILPNKSFEKRLL